MKNFLIGFVCGALIVGTAWAANRIVLVNGNGVEIGTTDNPLYITTV